MSRPKPSQEPGMLPSTTEPDALIVRYRYQDAAKVANDFHNAAERLASTFGAGPEDDTILLPFLFLYRHAFELELKYLIMLLASIREDYVDGPSPRLQDAQDSVWLRKNFGHNLEKLLTEVEEHYSALGLRAPFPLEARSTITALYRTDTSSGAFRYPETFLSVQEGLDFPALVQQLSDAFENLSLIEDYVWGIYPAAPPLGTP